MAPPQVVARWHRSDSARCLRQAVYGGITPLPHWGLINHCQSFQRVPQPRSFFARPHQGWRNVRL